MIRVLMRVRTESVPSKLISSIKLWRELMAHDHQEDMMRWLDQLLMTSHFWDSLAPDRDHKEAYTSTPWFKPRRKPRRKPLGWDE